MKEKSEASTRKFAEAVQVYNNLYEKFNELKFTADDKGKENVRLKKKLEEVEAILSAREEKFKEVQSKVEYYDENSTSIKMFTTVKVRA